MTYRVKLPAPVNRSYEPFPLTDTGDWLVLSDIHIPYHDVKTIELAIQMAVKQKVRGVLLNGDVMDSHELSSFDKDPTMPRYDAELKATALFLAYLRERLPKARIVFKEGNHEERLDRFLMRHAPALFGLKAVSLPHLLELGNYGIEHVADKRVVRLGRLNVLHGHEYRPQVQTPVNPARGIFLRAKSIVLCFPAGTTILCRSGFKFIENIVVGDEVLTHQSKWRSVTGVQSRTAERTVILKGHGHPRLITTPEHPFLGYNLQKKFKSGGLKEQEWIEASDMKGVYWASPCEFPAASIPPIVKTRGQQKTVEMSEDLMWLVGRWLGDGWVSPQGSVHICCDIPETPEIEKHVVAAGLKPSITNWKSRLSVFQINRSAWGKWLVEHFGKYAIGKTMPTWALGMEEGYREALLEGYISADGHENPNGSNWETSTVSRRLAIGIKLLAQSLGYPTTMYFTKQHEEMICGQKSVCKDKWRIRGVRKVRRWLAGTRHENYQLGKVKDITENGSMTVYNLTVAEDSSYIADGIVVHNCGHWHQTSEHHEPTISGKPQGAWSTGCACQLTPAYAPLNRWNHGFAMVELSKGGEFSVRNLRVWDGKVV